VQHLAGSFHRLTWANGGLAGHPADRHGALLVFAFMFAFKDRGMSRLFMGSLPPALLVHAHPPQPGPAPDALAAVL
jgi:hypothetical protein